ncbi:hypothetical protein D9758_018814 [Tetrapyrgos nigripes]|uniref:Glycerophosphocholine acyltransferase 1 n=1 Tax=Tetrapyrgos nigripes TaxID=182062 RepID=A0A8H5EUZ6_9AGAR|nr:hypothetical protein D9758_018979 [Tetrapyrgos nigripes]KAF5313540.1 hypothetical protein D9758_018814 [Tetrapyrgos nigripes]
MEFKEFKIKVAARMTKLSNWWHSAKVVQTKEKVSFFFGVMSVLYSALFFGLAPQCMAHIAYTLQALYLLPLRTYIYKKCALALPLQPLLLRHHPQFHIPLDIPCLACFIRCVLYRRENIESGQRTTSFSFFLNDQPSIIGRSLSAILPQSCIAAFMRGQLVYMVLTELPVVYLLYDSAFWSGVFC